MTLTQIKKAIKQGKKVHWGNTGYIVIKCSIGQYLIKCIKNNDCIGLTWQDGTTLNGKDTEFFIGE